MNDKAHKSHAGDLYRSARLLKLYRYLKSRLRKGATTREIVVKLETMNPGRDVSEINRNLFDYGIHERIDCEFVRTTKEKKKIYRYKLVNE